jgi:NAD(P)-dependent dehydrogenase (short-subunit alcohol dehydrogenase family)
MGGGPSKDTIAMNSRDWNGAGKVAIVTGPMGGIGFHTARWLAERGCHVILAGRSMERLRECERLIRLECKSESGQPSESDNVHLTSIVLDLGSLSSVEAFAREFQALRLPLNILINNAGIMNTPFQQTVDGFDAQLGTNHLGHFYLTQLLMPQLQAGAPSRVVNVASTGHKFAGMSATTLDQAFRPTKKEYGGWTSYGNSKLANILMARSIQSKFAQQGITGYSLHPGVVATDLGRQGGLTRFVYSAFAVAMKTAVEGAGTTVYCATSPESLLHAGGFFDKSSYSTNCTVKATDDVLAEALWQRSEQEIAKWKAAQQEGQPQAQAQGAAAAAASQ